MKAFKLAAAMAAFFMSAVLSFDALAARATSQVCRPAEHFVAGLSAAEKVSAHLQGDQAARFMEVYNAVPPKTRLHADEVLVLSKDGVANVAVLRFLDGCFQDYGVHPRNLAAWLLRNSVGQSL
ncbi:hypothetical protein [Pelagibius sp. Alg239-R121]|uniref:hypothetical protein n=1 Tax=Pelagibius sp. Alg239-R121 TaxID=2993448 RepID=UPI0024A7833B|nr:hypothetical protein [Pelagibius sp. Alg239-R121]